MLQAKKVQSAPVPEPKKALATTAPIFIPNAPIYIPTIPVFILIATVLNPETTMAIIPFQEHAKQEDLSFGMTSSVSCPASKAKGSVGKSQEKAGSLCQFCKIPNHTHSEDMCGENLKNICRFCNRSSHTHTTD